MTRTERASYPRAVIRDRSVSRSGLDGHIRKGGAGRHNWGDLGHEYKFESDALGDEKRAIAEEKEEDIPNGDARNNESDTDNKNSQKPQLIRSTSSISAQELQEAKAIRKNALKKQGIDLATIARTSAAISTSPPSSANAPMSPNITHNKDLQ